MNTLEHLSRIKARCEELLAIAEKRTPGKWSEDNCATVCLPTGKRIIDGFTNDPDATFIASCAGPAEAGWRATIAAIYNLELIHESTPLGEYAAWDALEEIIHAWPEELL